MLSIPILRGILNEYGLEELLNRLKRIQNLDLKIDNFKVNTTCTNEYIKINCQNPITISIEDELLKVTTEYKTYKVIRYYYNKELIRSLTVFTTSDEDLLVVDHLDNGNFLSTRISKTTPKDKNYNQGYYEREISEYPDLPININSHYLENANNIEEERVIDIAGHNLYYHHYNSTKINEYFREVALCSGKPYAKVSGHLRIPDDLIITALSRPNANIIIRGVDLNEDETPKQFYEVILDINEQGVLFTDIIMDYSTNQINRTSKQAIIRSNKRINEFSSTLLISLKTLIEKNNIIDESHKENILAELERLIDVLQIKEHQKTPSINTIDLMMNIIPDPNHLAYSIYENLSTYEQDINDELALGSTTNSLKR